MDGAAGRRVHRFRGVEEKRRIVEETLRDGPRSRRLRVRTASTPTRCFSGAGFIETVFWMLLRVEERCGCCRLRYRIRAKRNGCRSLSMIRRRLEPVS
jgi:hypothetical protein